MNTVAEVDYREDISLAEAVEAHAGISFSPERRGASDRESYAAMLQAFRAEIDQYGTTDELRALVDEQFERYREGFRRRFRAVLHAQGRTMSSMIAGPSNFPTHSNQKRLDTEMRRREELRTWMERARAAIHRIMRKATDGETDPVAEMRQQLAEAERLQEGMKAGNKIVRNKKLTTEQKIEQLQELGLTGKYARRAVSLDSLGRIEGFPAYATRNNLASIKRMRVRLAVLERKEKASSSPSTELRFPGGVIVENPGIDRLQIVFDAKPDAPTIAALKRNGFRWARSEGAWQRQLTGNAKVAARTVVGVQAA